jgi:fatty-acyl-CoA synthase
MMDWDSHRYLECFFAVPMMGAMLQTVNVRLSPEQILYTLNHAQADVLLVNSEFFPILQQIAGELETVKTFVLISDEAEIARRHRWRWPANTKPCWLLPTEFDFPDFDENAQATVFYTTGTTGNPKGVYFSHRQLVLHTLGCAAALGGAHRPGAHPPRRRVHADDADVPRPRLGLPLSGDDAGRQAGLSRALPAGRDLPPDQ